MWTDANGDPHLDDNDIAAIGVVVAVLIVYLVMVLVGCAGMMLVK